MMMASSVEVAGHPSDEGRGANVRLVSPGYFATLSISLRAGRDFTRSDTRSSPNGVIINETLARRLGPGAAPREPIGKAIDGLGTQGNTSHVMEVVGVSADIHDEQLRTPPAQTFYVPVEQTPPGVWPLIQRSLVVLVRGATPSGDADALLRPLGKTVATFDSSLPIADSRTLERVVRNSLSTARTTTLLLSLLGGIALALAVVGIYGVVAFFVAQRTREIGLRIALGATHGRIWRFVVHRGVAPIVVGLVVGIGLSMLTTNV